MIKSRRLRWEALGTADCWLLEDSQYKNDLSGFLDRTFLMLRTKEFPKNYDRKRIAALLNKQRIRKHKEHSITDPYSKWNLNL